jgi:hypothetical protein
MIGTRIRVLYFSEDKTGARENMGRPAIRFNRSGEAACLGPGGEGFAAILDARARPAILSGRLLPSYARADGRRPALIWYCEPSAAARAHGRLEGQGLARAAGAG